ncbi:hypothetical protein SCARR_03694 [Pontiella sulfatireligans]|uniref:Addiction module component n=2 Tax=Pontiella sulfatireligans TaxID=2750658 RepID=A0A6C2UMX9_9BACT|nr:hypothetical protein SCARR_03694 [Pontiella sulfatireligans]
MSTALALDKMTTDDKLRALEEIWDNLALTPSEAPAPQWHGEELISARRTSRQRTNPLQRLVGG